ncbi:hypothetical protein QUB37_26665 [Microcoleus sp. AT3-A2]|uniref:hypothetical protein n=1 Tax=Microcoleus sp. AT3-A2 TaxID=2818610 RepID=UPI002FD18229
MSFNEGRRKREEGRGKKEEGRRKREEGRGKKEEGRFFPISHSSHLPLSRPISHSLAPSPSLPLDNSQDIAY